MDWMTLFGFLFGFGIIAFAIQAGASWAAFLNWHGFGLVFGGVVSSAMINCSARELWQSFRAGLTLFRPTRYKDPYEVVGVLVRLAQQARRSGNMAIRNEGKDVEDGFLTHAINVCLNSSDETSARMVLEKEVNSIKVRHREVGNVFRTAGTLSPMFGLLGTIIGIVDVLKNITDPKSMGNAMAMALSTGFYGILFANMVCIPVAGKLRTRSLNEVTAKEVITHGVLTIFFTQDTSLLVEMKLLSFLKKNQNGGGPAGPAPSTKGEASS